MYMGLDIGKHCNLITWVFFCFHPPVKNMLLLLFLITHWSFAVEAIITGKGKMYFYYRCSIQDFENLTSYKHQPQETIIFEDLHVESYNSQE